MRFTFAKYENDMLSLCETTNAFIDVFCNSKIHFHQLGPFKLIKTMLTCLMFCKWNHYPKGSHNTWAT